MVILIREIQPRTSVAGTLMARLPRLFRTRSGVSRKNPICGIIKGGFLFIYRNGILRVLIRIEGWSSGAMVLASY